MGQKVNPHSLRLKINHSWNSKWFVDKRDYAEVLHEDLRLNRAIMKSSYTRGGDIANVEFIRQPQKISVIVDTARPGVLIGSKGENIERLSNELQKLTKRKLQIKIKEIKQPEKNAQIIALNVARQLNQRSAFRRTLKMAVENAVRSGVQGVKIKISGRLGGAEMSRSIALIRGRVPLHTLRAQIDYGFAESFTTYGTIGVKVWIFNGEVLNYNTKQDAGQLLKSKKNTRSPGQAGGRGRVLAETDKKPADKKPESKKPVNKQPANKQPADKKPADKQAIDNPAITKSITEQSE